MYLRLPAITLRSVAGTWIIAILFPTIVLPVAGAHPKWLSDLLTNEKVAGWMWSMGECLYMYGSEGGSEGEWMYARSTDRSYVRLVG